MSQPSSGVGQQPCRDSPDHTDSEHGERSASSGAPLGGIHAVSILKRPRGILLITSRLHGAGCAPGALGESEKLSGTSLVGGNPLEPFVEAFPLVGAEAETGRKGTLQCAFVGVQVVNYRPPTLSKTGHFRPLAAPSPRGSGVSLGKVSLDNAGHHAKTLAGL